MMKFNAKTFEQFKVVAKQFGGRCRRYSDDNSFSIRKGGADHRAMEVSFSLQRIDIWDCNGSLEIIKCDSFEQALEIAQKHFA